MRVTNLRSTHIIKVPIETDIFVRSPIATNNSQIIREVRMWLYENVGLPANSLPDLVSDPHTGWYYEPTDFRKVRGGERPGLHNVKFIFVDKKKAALFKLTWV